MIRRFKDLKMLRLIGYLVIYNLVILESLSAQSFFSMKGFGEEIIYSGAYASSLGGLIGLSDENPSFSGGHAPVSGLILNKTNFNGSILSNFVYGHENSIRNGFHIIEPASGKSRLIYDIRPIVFSGKIPLPYNFRVGFKLNERFNQNFDIYSDSTELSGYWTRRHIIGKGGIYGLSFNIGKVFPTQRISLGLEYSKLLGQSLERWYFDVLNGNYRTEDSLTNNYSAHSLRFGACSQISFLTLGLLVEDILPGKISSRVVSYNTVVDSVDDLKFNLPYSFGISVMVDKFKETKFYLDGFYRAWDKTTIADTVVTKYQNSMKYSVAVEHWLNDNFPLRVAVRYYASYLTDRTERQITEYALSCGSSVAITKFGYIDYSLELVQRQGKEVKENIARLNVSLSYEEVWKKRTRRWGY